MRASRVLCADAGSSLLGAGGTLDDWSGRRRDATLGEMAINNAMTTSTNVAKRRPESESYAPEACSAQGAFRNTGPGELRSYLDDRAIRMLSRSASAAARVPLDACGPKP